MCDEFVARPLFSVATVHQGPVRVNERGSVALKSALGISIEHAKVELANAQAQTNVQLVSFEHKLEDLEMVDFFM